MTNRMIPYAQTDIDEMIEREHANREALGVQPPGFGAWLSRADRLPDAGSFFTGTDGHLWQLSSRFEWVRLKKKVDG